MRFMRNTMVVVCGLCFAATGACSTSSKTVPGPTMTVTTTLTTSRTTLETETITERPTVVKTVATRTRTVTKTYTPPPPRAYYRRGRDLPHSRSASGPDLPLSGGGSYCAWFRLRDAGRGVTSTGNVIDFLNSTGGPLTVTVQSSDGALLIQGDCTFRSAS